MADQTPEDWLSYGKNYAEDRFSELTDINKENIEQLGLVWSLNVGTKRGIEATPLVVNGILYLSLPWSKVVAVDVRKGETIWEFDPKVPKAYGEKACCDVVNRGVAIYEGKVFLGTLNGKLIALDAATGSISWEQQTVDTTKAYTITGAPRVVNGKVIIGNGGAEYGVRGYITAYDAHSGEQQWRFYTVPGDPAKGFESPAMEAAAKSWDGEWWKYGGGGTAWDAMAYDPALNLLYVGTGNGSPWNRDYRSPKGGDNLYVSSILAINPDNGELIWYYQTTPGDTWDYTATQHLMLADLTIEGQVRQVIMQAPKNGFFYVLDRTDGSLISAEPYIYLNWAQKVDLTTGRPIETDFSRYQDVNAVIFPGPGGGHNWQPMAFNRTHNLVYIPTHHIAHQYGNDPNWVYDTTALIWNLGTGMDPRLPIRQDTTPPLMEGRLIAWDPAEQKEKWRVVHQDIWNSGVLATAADLVFQGSGDGFFYAFDAKTGENLWKQDLKTGIIGSPISYMVDDVQYITIAVGWGGIGGFHTKSTETINPGTLYTFALGGKASMPEYPVSSPPKTLIELAVSGSAESIANGQVLYGIYCQRCHGMAGMGGGIFPDLAYSNPGVYQNFEDYVLKGLLLHNGMPVFEGRLDGQQVEDIKQFVLSSVEVLRNSQ